MTLLKALLSLAALLLLSVVPTETEVVHSMAECKGFFLNDIPPNIPGILEGGNIQDQNRYKPICQTLNNTRTFVTLYDTKNKIPVFSAGKFRGSYEGNRSKHSPWMIEPQLENPADSVNMKSAYKNKTYKNQAVPTDYNNMSGFNRGHLFPSSYGFDKTEIKSTYTLTNIVPQNEKVNRRFWSLMEQCIKCVMNESCRDKNNNKEGFVVTGAQPSNNTNPSNLPNNTVNIPSVLWSAFCCSTQDQWLASAYWGENIDPKDTYLQPKTLKELHEKLGVNVFPGPECPHDTTIKQVDPKLISSCNCPSRLTTTAPAVTIR